MCHRLTSNQRTSKACVPQGRLRGTCSGGASPLDGSPLRAQRQAPDDSASSSTLSLTRRCIGPYANAVLRFEIDFPVDYPAHPPTVTFLSDVFHPLVTPLTTYTYTMRDAGGDTMSAADRDRLPPGGLSLRHGFPEWFNDVRGGSNDKDASLPLVESEKHSAAPGPEALGSTRRPPMTVEVLQYMRIVFDTEAMLDSVPLGAAANPGAWHAWKSYRAKALGGRASPVAHLPSNPSDTTSERSTSPWRQPGGARRPAEWNWQGVWEDRVRKCLQASISEPMLFAGDSNDVICFSKMDPDAVQQIKPV